jgi:hypothetical protein
METVHYCNCSYCPDSITKKQRKKIIDKIYYEKKIKPIKDKVSCGCGGSYINTRAGHNQHVKTKKHQKFSKNSSSSMSCS